MLRTECLNRSGLLKTVYPIDISEMNQIIQNELRGSQFEAVQCFEMFVDVDCCDQSLVAFSWPYAVGLCRGLRRLHLEVVDPEVRT